MASPLRKKNVSTIPLSIRGKKRYILFRLVTENETSTRPVTKDAFSHSLNAHLVHCFGVLGLPLHRVRLIAFNPANQKGILRCAHTSKDALITALLSYSSFNNQKAIIRTISTSGTLLSLKGAFHQSADR